MPYVIISTQIRLDVGPTVVGDEWSDRELMEYLDATLIKQLGNNYAQYRTEAAPRVVLEKLEKRGYKLVAMTGVGQTCIWTLHKEISDSEKALSSSSSDAFESPKIESRVAGDVEPLSQNHELVRLLGRKKGCRECASNSVKTPGGRTPETTYGCKFCSVHLCKGICFSNYHQKLCKV
ncbi:uncharacterized protein LOC131956470 isoform X2 [Physella acuta]|uniref:uncharacterized protein LOC131956470 isoform X2 n=1 Tax=Physella acuta TaxID=109671 RepID=UPI0027DC3FEB|nr:uncharacterized protein LOC131956470 isoform X2 [Physella acuta]